MANSATKVTAESTSIARIESWKKAASVIRAGSLPERAGLTEPVVGGGEPLDERARLVAEVARRLFVADELMVAQRVQRVARVERLLAGDTRHRRGDRRTDARQPHRRDQARRAHAGDLLDERGQLGDGLALAREQIAGAARRAIGGGERAVD